MTIRIRSTFFTFCAPFLQRHRSLEAVENKKEKGTASTPSTDSCGGNTGNAIKAKAICLVHQSLLRHIISAILDFGLLQKMEIYDPEEQIMCPYNSAHYIRRCRMNTHLVKCLKSNPESKLVECDFNVNHRIPEPQLQYHHENCRDRKPIEITTYQEEGSFIDKYPIPKIEVPTEESWDNDNFPTYDPKKYCEANEIVRKVDVESAAKRKQFRIAERERINQLHNNKPGNMADQQRSAMLQLLCASKCKLPKRSGGIMVHEATPPSVKELLKRICIGKNKPFIPTEQ